MSDSKTEKEYREKIKTLKEAIKIAKELNILSQNPKPTVEPPEPPKPIKAQTIQEKFFLEVVMNSRSLTDEESEKTAKAIEEMSESDGKTIF